MQGIIDAITFSNPNAHAGRPTISNTDNWNTICYGDGQVIEGAQIHPGRIGTDGGGISKGCLVCSDADYGRLNQMFEKTI